MNYRVWKYPLEVTGEQFITLPANAELLTIQVQNDIPCLWALVNPEPGESKLTWRLRTLMTGEPIGYDEAIGRYFATYQCAQLVYHVFVSYR